MSTISHWSKTKALEQLKEKRQKLGTWFDNKSAYQRRARVAIRAPVDILGNHVGLQPRSLKYFEFVSQSFSLLAGLMLSVHFWCRICIVWNAPIFPCCRQQRDVSC